MLMGMLAPDEGVSGGYAVVAAEETVMLDGKLLRSWPGRNRCANSSCGSSTKLK